MCPASPVWAQGREIENVKTGSGLVTRGCSLFCRVRDISQMSPKLKGTITLTALCFLNIYLFGCAGSQLQYVGSQIFIAICGIQFPGQGLNRDLLKWWDCCLSRWTTREVPALCFDFGLAEQSSGAYFYLNKEHFFLSTVENIVLSPLIHFLI